MGVNKKVKKFFKFSLFVLLFTFLIVLLFPLKTEVDAVKDVQRSKMNFSFKSYYFLHEKIINPEIGDIWIDRLNSKEKQTEAAMKQPTKEEKPEKVNKEKPSKGKKKPEKPSKNTPIESSPKNIDKTVYLTFDDGPAQATTEILNLLSKYNVKATFFMLEPSMKQYPQIVQRVIQEGHKIGFHGVTHDKNKYYLNRQTVVSEMIQGQQILQEITGIFSNIIRTPYGSKPHMTFDYIQAVAQAGFQMWDWNIDSEDWKLTDGTFVQNTIQQINHFKKEEPIVILLHDRETTAKHLEDLLKYLMNNGYKMDVLNEELQPVQF
jgi:peptidoglycan-N-acetylglucosamine deacetylase